jgi:hypothetical protein
MKDSGMQAIHLWEGVAAGPAARNNAADAPDTVQRAPGQGVDVRVLERPTVRTAVVSWTDPICCRYGDQVWVTAKAPHDGHCALSGLPIVRGDRIYRPRPTDPMPRNAKAMMLAVRVERTAYSTQREQPFQGKVNRDSTAK